MLKERFYIHYSNKDIYATKIDKVYGITGAFFNMKHFKPVSNLTLAHEIFYCYLCFIALEIYAIPINTYIITARSLVEMGLSHVISLGVILRF
jgi:hypothetical protein